MRKTHPVFQIDAIDLVNGRVNVEDVESWARPHLHKNQPFLISASAPPARVQEAQERLGSKEVGELIENTLANIVKKLTKRGLRRLVVAGGETSGAVVQSLGVKGLRIGPEIAPGVPCTVTLDKDPMALTLKSGNFGDEEFFLKALKVMP